MRVYGQTDILGIGPHFQRQHRLGDQFTRVGTVNTGTEDAFSLFIKQNLG